MKRLLSIALVAAAAVLLPGCETDGATGADSLAKTADASKKPPKPTPSPTAHVHTEPPPAGWVLSPTPTGMEPIASGFDPALGLQRSWGTGAIPVSSAPDVLGAFRMTCGADALAYIDPIVYPGTVGQSHLHQFYGLKGVTPDETYASARANNRSSTCGVADYSLNKSMYWLPALLDGRGNVIQPNLVSIYYKRRPKTDPKCNWTIDPQGQAEECVNMPQGLRLLAGFDMLNPAASAARVTQGALFYCSGPGAGTAKADNLEAVLPSCPGEVKLYVSMDYPSCWDGKHLDSPDHRSHLAWASYGSWGYLRCPATHPKLIPTLHVAAEYSLVATDDRSLIRLSSDVIDGLPRGKTLHGDFMPSWDPVAWQAFHDNCIDKLLNCSGGDLGNGWQLRGASQPSYGWTNPNRLVPIPARPS